LRYKVFYGGDILVSHGDLRLLFCFVFEGVRVILLVAACLGHKSYVNIIRLHERVDNI
jgi:hypothetical protein